MMILILLADRT